jgi:chromosome segregation ATPase
MSDPLLERVESLKAKLDDLASKGADDLTLFELRSRISRLSLAIIVSELEEEDEAYASATRELDQAIATVEAAKADMSSVEKAIDVAAKTVALVEKTLDVVP